MQTGDIYSRFYVDHVGGLIGFGSIEDHLNQTTQPSSKIQITLLDGTQLDVARIFLLDFERSVSSNQRFYVNRQRISGTSDPKMIAAVISEIYRLVNEDKALLFKLTETASQKVMIDLRNRVDTEFAERFSMVEVDLLQYTALTRSTFLHLDKSQKTVECKLEGLFNLIVDPVEGETLINPLGPPIRFSAQSIYNLAEEEIQYSSVIFNDEV